MQGPCHQFQNRQLQEPSPNDVAPWRSPSLGTVPAVRLGPAGRKLLPIRARRPRDTMARVSKTRRKLR